MREPRPAGRSFLAALLATLSTAGCGAPGDPAVCQRAQALSRPTQCGPTLDVTPVHQYRGLIEGLEDREDAVALINGLCTGTLIAATAGPVVLTAGHCVALGERVVVAFNVEDDPDGDPLVTEGTVIEQGADVDFALLQLDAQPRVTPIALGSQPTELLALVHHPRGRPKVISEGRYLAACNGLLYYADLDTLVGSSGAGVLNLRGQLVAVHTDGNCQVDGGGANWGATVAAILAGSRYLQPADVTGN